MAGAAAAAPLAAGSAEALPSVSAADAASEPAVAASSSFPAVDFDGAFGSGAPAAEAPAARRGETCLLHSDSCERWFCLRRVAAVSAVFAARVFAEYAARDRAPALTLGVSPLQASAAGGATSFFDNAFAGSWAAGGLATAASRGSAGSLDSSDALPAPEAAPAQLFDAAFGGGAVSPPVAPAEPSVFDAFGVASVAADPSRCSTIPNPVPKPSEIDRPRPARRQQRASSTLLAPRPRTRRRGARPSSRPRPRPFSTRRSAAAGRPT